MNVASFIKASTSATQFVNIQSRNCGSRWFLVLGFPRFRVSRAFSILKDLTFSQSNHYQTKVMSRVVVKNVASAERLEINLDLITDGGAVKTFNMNRLKTEEHGVALERLRLNLSKKMSKKKKKKKPSNMDPSSSESVPQLSPDTDSSVLLNIFKGEQELLPNVENENAWIEGAILRYGEENISILCNLPSVKIDKFPSLIMAGFPLYPVVELDFCDLESCEFYWKAIDSSDAQRYTVDISRGKSIEYKDAIRGLCYTPTQNDIGKQILLVCIPRNEEREGKPDARLSQAFIEPGPSQVCPFEKRHEFTKTRSKAGQFRVVSYNLLADVYSSTDAAQTKLFNYCPKEFLDMNRRKHLLIKETVGFQADLLCFQEVDCSIFTSYLEPAFKSMGFQGLLRPKSRQVSEGCAMFIRNDKFRLVKQHDIVLSEFLSQDPSCQDIWEKVKEIEPLKVKMEQRSSILQVAVVESLEDPSKFICLTNTHFYFHPEACNARLIHAATALRHLSNIVNSYQQEGNSVAVVFCGDFNSLPWLGVFQLITAQFVPDDHVDWKSGGKEETMTGLDLNHSMPLESACGIPQYTNFTVGFQATLDYIFIESSKLQVTSVVPMPEHSDVIEHIALPNAVFPSDHIPLVCDLAFKS